ncbi:unnamed protein product [Lactuca virosa]|uniref:Calmodulin-binding domain-containing protein n=1 Tax=Lactuca virosa TaxID=75947 RepID=A0AAU9P9G9_9ASTR|nr:unnamed protein product [Lactuca virosa]
MMKRFFQTLQGVLLPKKDEGSSKKSRRSKKAAKSTPKQKVQEPRVTKSPKKQPKEVEKVSTTVPALVETEAVETVKETISSKSGVFKRIKQKVRDSCKSPERSSIFSPSFTRKAHITRKGVMIREVPAHVSPSSKKRIAEDMAKQISKKTKKRKLVLQHPSSEDEEEVPETPEFELSTKVSSPEKTQVIPPEVSSTESVLEEV